MGGFTCFIGIAPQVPMVKRRQCLVTFFVEFRLTSLMQELNYEVVGSYKLA